MNCDEAGTMIHAYLDGELDVLHSLEMDRHIAECAACSTAAHRIESVRTAVRDQARATLLRMSSSSDSVALWTPR